MGFKLKRFYTKTWFLVWVIIYSILYYLFNLLSDIIPITNNIIKILFISFLISVFSRIIWCCIHKRTFRINGSLFLWTFVFFILIFLFEFIYISNFVIKSVLLGIYLSLMVHLLKKLRYKKLKTIVTMCVVFLIIYFIFVNFADTFDSEILSLDSNFGLKDVNSFKSDFVVKRCSDNTFYNRCSISQKGYYCKDGNLIEYFEKCLCKSDEIYDNNICVSKFKVNPKEITLNYTLRGNQNNIDFIVYGGLNDYLSGLDRTVWYSSYESPPTDKEMELKFVFQDDQIEMLSSLVDKIKAITSNKDNQARIAISIVQSLDYDWDGYNGIHNNRYAYETLYDEKGVCAEKSRLLAVLLKELDFGVALFNYSVESHEAVGIKCPLEYSYINSGYCFIESTSPTIITNSYEKYIGAGKLMSIPNIYVVSDGDSFDSVNEEYNDYQRFSILGDKLDSYGASQTLSESKYKQWKKYHDEYLELADKYGIKFSNE